VELGSFIVILGGLKYAKHKHTALIIQSAWL